VLRDFDNTIVVVSDSQMHLNLMQGVYLCIGYFYLNGRK